eukprot:COSAG05_NODE_452_length_9699_cov_33.848125_1_plen_377_part_00
MGSLWPALVLMAGLVAAAGQAAASDPAAWTNVRVQRWARELPLPKDVADQFAARLEKEDYTGADLMGMDKDEMRELGITKMGQLKRIAAAVAKLQTKQAPDPADSGASKEDWELEAKLEQERAAARVLEAELKLERDARHKAELEKERDARRQAEAGTAERLMEAQRAAERGREEAAERGARERADVRNGKDRYDSRADRQESADRRSSAHSEHVEREAGAGRQQSERSESRHERGMEREANAKRQHSADEGNAQRQRTYSEEYAVFGIGGTKGFTELPWFLTWYPILVACFLSGTRSFLLLGLFLASYAILIKRIGDDTADDVMSLNFFAWGFFNCFLLWVMLNPTTTGSDTFRAPNTAAHAAPGEQVSQREIAV